MCIYWLSSSLWWSECLCLSPNSGYWNLSPPPSRWWYEEAGPLGGDEVKRVEHSLMRLVPFLTRTWTILAPRSGSHKMKSQKIIYYLSMCNGNQFFYLYSCVKFFRVCPQPFSPCLWKWVNPHCPLNYVAFVPQNPHFITNDFSSPSWNLFEKHFPSCSLLFPLS